MRRFVLILGVAALFSCGRPETPAPVRSYYTPTKTLYTLKLAYNAPDYRTYEALFSPEEYLLEAEAPPAGMPRPWRFREEMDATRALFRDAYHVAEIPYRGRRVAPAPQAGDSRHSGVIPPAHELFFHELEEPPFREDRVGEVQARELYLLGMVHPQLVQEPVI